MPWSDRSDVVVQATNYCHYCNAPCDDQYVVPLGTNSRYGRITTHAARVCICCFMQEEAIVEARERCWRFSEIDFFDPCICGRASVVVFGRHCYTCAKDRRMLGYQAAELKRFRRILTEIRKEVRSIECV